MQTKNTKTALEEKTLQRLCLMEEIAEKKANVYARLLIEPSLTKSMEETALRHQERRAALERLLYGKPIQAKESKKEDEKQ